jgi:hypothetical protein
MKGAAYPIWSYIFLAAEIIMCIGLWIGHISRSFPVQREKVYMDDLVEADPQTGILHYIILLCYYIIILAVLYDYIALYQACVERESKII